MLTLDDHIKVQLPADGLVVLDVEGNIDTSDHNAIFETPPFQPLRYFPLEVIEVYIL